MALKNVENRLERLFERTLSRPFKNALQPIEIGTRIIREIDLSRRLSSNGPISPNNVQVWLSSEDAERFNGFQKALIAELEESVRQHALNEGYNFVGPVAVEVFIDDELKTGNIEVDTKFVGGESEPRLICADGRSFAIGDRPLIIGRSPECDLQMNDNFLSSRHARIASDSGELSIEDLQSTNGTYVNQQIVKGRVHLERGDIVQVGGVLFEVVR